MDLSQKELDEFTSRTARPIAGQSLTDNPATPYPWEKPPEFTSKDDAIEHYLGIFTIPETYEAIMDSLEEGIPVMDLVQMYLMDGFKKGEINADLMMLLAEPLAYLLLGLSERAGIKARITDEDEAIDEEEDEEDEIIEPLPSTFRNKLNTIKNPQDDEESSLDEKLDALPSLMSRGE